MATHSSILAWKISRKEEPRRLQSMGYKEFDATELFRRTPFFKAIYTEMYMGEGMLMTGKSG